MSFVSSTFAQLPGTGKWAASPSAMMGASRRARTTRSTATPPTTVSQVGGPTRFVKFQPGGASGHEGSGCQPGGGVHPLGGEGQPGGGLNADFAMNPKVELSLETDCAPG